MKNRFLWILCALLSLLVLTGGCNRKPASTADVPRSLSHQYKIAVAPFTQPRDISQLIMGQLPQPQALAARDVLIAQDRQLRDVLYTTTKRSYDFLPRTRPLPDLKRFHTSERPQALPLWVEYARTCAAGVLPAEHQGRQHHRSLCLRGRAAGPDGKPAQRGRLFQTPGQVGHC